MYWNRFDIVEAYYLFFCDYHGGMYSPEYRRLSEITTYFKPKPNLSYETLEENAKCIYDNLVSNYSLITLTL